MRGARAANGERVRLETILTPSGRRTSREAIARFIALLTNPDGRVPAAGARAKQVAAAEAELVASGFKLAN
jgi:hypothetical protein